MSGVWRWLGLVLVCSRFVWIIVCEGFHVCSCLFAVLYVSILSLLILVSGCCPTSCFNVVIICSWCLSGRFPNALYLFVLLVLLVCCCILPVFLFSVRLIMCCTCHVLPLCSSHALPLLTCLLLPCIMVSHTCQTLDYSLCRSSVQHGAGVRVYSALKRFGVVSSFFAFINQKHKSESGRNGLTSVFVCSAVSCNR